jgi:hypothetical protein
MTAGRTSNSDLSKLDIENCITRDGPVSEVKIEDSTPEDRHVWKLDAEGYDTSRQNDPHQRSHV